MSMTDARQFRERQEEHEAARILLVADISQTNFRQRLIEQLRQEEASEDTEHLIGWLTDAWATLDLLIERFGETRAWQLYTVHYASQQGTFYANLT